RLFRTGLTTALTLTVFLSTAALAAAKTVYVSPKGKDTAACTKAAPCKTIAHAIAKAKKGDVVSVAHGTYAEGVKITKDISVAGVGNPVVNAAGQGNGFLITGPGAAGALVRGFVVKHATDEGILALKTTRVTIEDNTLHNNDLGVKAATPVGECAASQGVPGDCGEALQLMSVTRSLVTRNTVKDNLGGILLTDEAGPTADNTISHNDSSDNVDDCGITLAGHNPKATANGKPKPKLAGVYGNKILDNVVDGDGTKGQGAGIIMAGGAPGAGVYNNLVEGNTAKGNGLAGIEIHSHSFGPKAPAADLNGNRIIGNTVSHDGLADSSDAEFSPADFAKGATVGIMVGSDVVKLKGIVVRNNTISDTHFGIWTKNDAAKVSAKKNAFHKVSVKVKQT
ncbi:MAG: right-handed parallel beta-helix repeat-containing protein, partial [Solirubrobacteraceae bacterium]